MHLEDIYLVKSVASGPCTSRENIYKNVDGMFGLCLSANPTCVCELAGANSAHIGRTSCRILNITGSQCGAWLSNAFRKHE
jgi:hypothetical protein